jgi:hypothetical protein
LKSHNVVSERRLPGAESCPSDGRKQPDLKRIDIPLCERYEEDSVTALSTSAANVPQRTRHHTAAHRRDPNRV